MRGPLLSVSKTVSFGKPRAARTSHGEIDNGTHEPVLINCPFSQTAR